MAQILFEFSLGHWFEHFKTKNLLCLTFCRKIVIEIQRIYCEMTISYANSTKYEISCISIMLFEFLIEHWFELFKTKNFVYLTLFQTTVVEIKCIDCESYHFRCQFDKISNFLNVLYLDFIWIFNRALFWIF